MHRTLTAPTRDLLQRVACDTRRFLETEERVLDHLDGRRFPHKWCATACSLLVRRLSDFVNVQSVRIANAQRLDASGQLENHYWLISGEVIVDITADQFPDFAGGSVFVGTDDAWHGEFTKNPCMRQADALIASISTDQELASLYERFLAWLDERMNESHPGQAC